MKDRYGRNIQYMRISVTDLCNLRCQYCMPGEGIHKKHHVDVLTFEEIIEIVEAGTKLGINKIRITGGEPLVKKDIVYFIQQLSQINGINDLAMTTNGILFSEYGQALKNAGLQRVNISIDSLRSDRYREITRGGELKKALKGIQTAIKLNMTPVKLNVVIIGGYNEDEITDFAQMTLEDSIDVRFIELMPVGEASKWAMERFVSNEIVKQKIGTLLPLENELSSPAEYYKIPGAVGRIGFINPVSKHFCIHCNRIRLTCDGKIKPCLHGNNEIDILKIVRNYPEKIEETMKEAILGKPGKHLLHTDCHQTLYRNMHEIGG